MFIVCICVFFVFWLLKLQGSLRTGIPSGGTLGRYGRYDSQQAARSSKFGPAPQLALSRKPPRPALDYSSDTEATISAPRSSYYYYNRPTMNSIPRNPALNAAADLAKFNSLPRERVGARIGLRSRLGILILNDIFTESKNKQVDSCLTNLLTLIINPTRLI